MHSRHDRRCYTSDSLTLREGQSRTIAVAMAEHLVMARTYAPDCGHGEKALSLVPGSRFRDHHTF